MEEWRARGEVGTEREGGRGVGRMEVSDRKGGPARTLMLAAWRLIMLRVNIPLLVTSWGLMREGEGEREREGVEGTEEREWASQW